MQIRSGTVFRVSLYALTIFATIVLAIAEGGWLVYATVPVMLLGGWYTERQRTAGFNATWTNITGLIAFFIAGVEFFSPNEDSKLLAGTHLIAYLLAIVCLQRKTIREYWAILALGLLEVALAAVLTNAGWYGGAMLTYAVLAIWTLILQSIAMAQEGSATHLTPATVQTSSTSLVWNDVRGVGSERWLSLSFVFGVLMLATGSLALSGFLFLVTPRMQIAPSLLLSQRLAETLVRARLGPLNSIQLGRDTPARDPYVPIMTITQTTSGYANSNSITPQALAELLGYDEPLYRSSVLTVYEEGRWRIGTLSDWQHSLENAGPNASRPRLQALYRQHVVMEPIDPTALYAIGVPASVEISDLHGEVHCCQFTQTLSREIANAGTRIEFTADYQIPDTVSVSRTGPQVPISYAACQDYEDIGYLRECLAMPIGLAELRNLAGGICTAAEQRRGRKLTAIDQAQALADYLRTDGGFKYALRSKRSDSRIDPIEEFLFARREGNCEYFASALTLMLRARGIPARVVLGYKGAERNLAGTYTVYSRNAHAWVEYWPHATTRLTSLDNPGWLVIDATPADSARESDPAKQSPWDRLSSTTQEYWSNYVVNYSPDSQQMQFYAPMKRFLDQQLEYWNAQRASFEEWWKAVRTNPRQWLSGRGAFVLGLLCFAIIGVAQLVQRYGPRWRRWWQGWRAERVRRRQQQQVVAFYERFAWIMRRRGLQRPAHQTQQEFATAVFEQVAKRLGVPSLLSFPERVCAAFYRVRFGGEILPSQELIALEQELQLFQQALQRS